MVAFHVCSDWSAELDWNVSIRVCATNGHRQSSRNSPAEIRRGSTTKAAQQQTEQIARVWEALVWMHELTTQNSKFWGENGIATDKNMCAMILVRWSHPTIRARCIGLSDPIHRYVCAMCVCMCGCLWWGRSLPRTGICTLHLSHLGRRTRRVCAIPPIVARMVGRSSYETIAWNSILFIIGIWLETGRCTAKARTRAVDGWCCVPRRRIRWISKYLGFSWLCVFRCWLRPLLASQPPATTIHTQMHECAVCWNNVFALRPCWMCSFARSLAGWSAMASEIFIYSCCWISLFFSSAEWAGRNGWTHPATTQHNDCTFIC